MSPLFHFNIPGKSWNKYSYAFPKERSPVISLRKFRRSYFHGGSALIKINFFQFSVIGALPEFSSNLLQDEIIKFPWQLNGKVQVYGSFSTIVTKVQVKLTKENECRTQHEGYMIITYRSVVELLCCERSTGFPDAASQTFFL